MILKTIYKWLLTEDFNVGKHWSGTVTVKLAFCNVWDFIKQAIVLNHPKHKLRGTGEGLDSYSMGRKMKQKNTTFSLGGDTLPFFINVGTLSENPFLVLSDHY